MSLQELLSKVIPDGKKFSLVHLQSFPKQTHSLVTPKTRQDIHSKTTVKTQHFFSLSYNEKVFFALEIYVYITIDDTRKSLEKLIFISKADTNGYCDTKVSIHAVTKTILQYLLAIDASYYLERVKPIKRKLKSSSNLITASTTSKRALNILSQRVADNVHNQTYINDKDLYVKFKCSYSPLVTKICLFTRAEPQYLFADSSKNPGKHILSGEKLLKWWLSIVDELVCENFDSDTEAKLQIPGEDNSVIRNYFRKVRFTDWKVGDIFMGSPQDIAVYKIPVFPDDPKSRFLEHLVEESRAKTTRLSAFWTELQARQEFRLGVTVSVIGVSGLITNTPTYRPSEDETIIPSSKKGFNKIKSYITGEVYSTEEGALDAHMNLKDFLEIRMAKRMVTVQGTMQLTPDSKLISKNLATDKEGELVNVLTIKRPVVNNLNTMIRKKPKNK